MAEFSMTPSERLITMLLCDISKKLGAEHEIDPEFVTKAIARDKEWALLWHYETLDHKGQFEKPQNVKETCDILEMWLSIERSYAELSSEEKAQVAENAAPFGKDVVFKGFDGNNEKHYGIAQFLVNELDRWEPFKGRDFNAHAPTLPVHMRMLKVFKAITEPRMDWNLSCEEIIEVLKAQAHSA